MLENLWTFVYHRGPAHSTGIVRASSEATAFLVAQKWIEGQSGCRGPANVKPMVLADESILGLPATPTQPEMPADPVGATTGTKDFSKRK